MLEEKINKPCPTCNGTGVIKVTREGTEISSNISVPCYHCQGIPEFLEGVIGGGKALDTHEEQRIKRDFEREYILEIKHGCQQCSGEIREHTEKIGDNGEMVIMCPHAMRILEQHSWIKPDKHDRERVIGE